MNCQSGRVKDAPIYMNRPADHWVKSYWPEASINAGRNTRQ